MFAVLLDKFRKADGYLKRGIIYCSISLIGILYELAFVRPIRPIVLILWTGVIGIGVIVMTSLKDEGK